MHKARVIFPLLLLPAPSTKRKKTERKKKREKKRGKKRKTPKAPEHEKDSLDYSLVYLAKSQPFPKLRISNQLDLSPPERF